MSYESSQRSVDVNDLGRHLQSLRGDKIGCAKEVNTQTDGTMVTALAIIAEFFGRGDLCKLIIFLLVGLRVFSDCWGTAIRMAVEKSRVMKSW